MNNYEFRDTYFYFYQYYFEYNHFIIMCIGNGRVKFTNFVSPVTILGPFNRRDVHAYCACAIIRWTTSALCEFDRVIWCILSMQFALKRVPAYSNRSARLVRSQLRHISAASSWNDARILFNTCFKLIKYRTASTAFDPPPVCWIVCKNLA